MVGCNLTEEGTTRFGMVIGLKPEKVEEYKRLHAECWPAVMKTLSNNNVRNFAIFIKEPENLLFGAFDFVGEDYVEAQKRIAECPATKAWLKLTDPCQEPLPTRTPGEWWAFMPLVFHMD